MKRAVLFISLLASLLFTWRVLAQDQPRAADDTYTIEWYTIDGGGGSIDNETYALNGTIGQLDAALSSDGSYSLIGGYWAGITVPYRIYLPLIIKNSEQA
jgi:hypothetical protein